jgi:TRAP-type C4-dicarboxylate transport system permease small subunit
MLCHLTVEFYQSFIICFREFTMRKTNEVLLWICKMLIMIMVPAMTMVVFAQVLMRYVFLSPFPWAEEVARFLLVWISCVGAAYGVKKKMHISILFLSKRFVGYKKSMMALVIHIMVLSLFWVCFYEGIGLSLAQWDQISPASRIPMTWAYLGVPVGFGFMIMFGLEFLIDDVKRIVAGKGIFSDPCD